MDTYDNKLYRKIARASALIPTNHRLPLRDGEVTDSRTAAYHRLQNYAFTQGFAVVITQVEIKKREQYMFVCTRYGNKTKDTRKNTEVTEKGVIIDYRKRPNSYINWNNCLYKIKLRYYKRDAVWRLTVIDDYYNYDMLDDPFLLPEYYPRDPNRDAALEQGRDLRASGLLFNKARLVMRTKGLRLTKEEYYNLQMKGKKRTVYEELMYALKTLENMYFSVRLREKYIIENNVKKA